MADFQRIERSLQNALDAGDTAAAEVIQQRLYATPGYKQYRQQRLDEVDEKLFRDPGTALGASRSFLQGATFGFSDELAAGVLAPYIAATEDKPIGEAYREAQTQLDEEQRRFEERNPVTSAVAEIPGAIATGGAGIARAVPSLAGKSVFTKTLAAMGLGGAEGAIYGAGKARPGEIVEDAATGGAVGAALGPVAMAAGPVIDNTLGPVARYAGKKLFSTPKAQATGYLTNQLAQEGIGTNYLAEALRQYGPDATLADASTAARNTLEGVIHKGDAPAVANAAEALFEARNAGQQSRLVEGMMDQMGLAPNTNFQQQIRLLQQQRGAVAGPLYEQAFKFPLRNTEKLQSIIRAPAMTKALTDAETIAANQRIAGDQVTHMRLFDLAKQSLDDQIGVAMRQGEKGRARDLVRLKKDLVDELDKQVPVYKQARDVFASSKSLEDAAQQGRRVLLDDADVTADVIKAMSESEKQMYRVGAAKAIRDKFAQASQSGDATKRIGATYLRERVRNAFPNEEAFKRFVKQVEIEQDIYKTTSIMGNSATARRTAEMERLSGAGPRIEGNNVAEVVTNLGKRILGSGLSPEAQEELGRLTMQRLGDIDLPALQRAVNEIALPDEFAGPARRWLGELMQGGAMGVGVPVGLVAQQREKPSREAELARALRGY